MGASTLHTITPNPNEVLIRPAALTIESDDPVDERSAASGVRVFDRSDALVRGYASVAADGRRIEWRPSRPLPSGPYRLSAEELIDAGGRPIDATLDVPFAVMDTSMAVPSNVEIRSLRMVVPEGGAMRSIDGSTRGAARRGRSIAILKALHTKTGEPATLALDREGREVDLDEIRRTAAQAHAKRYGKVTPALARRLERAKGDRRIHVAVWLAGAEDPVDPQAKSAYKEGADDARRERPEQAQRSDRTADAVGRFMASTEKLLGDVRLRGDRLAPVVYGELTREQIEALARNDDVAAIFPYDPRPVLDLTNSLAISEATSPQAAGTTGAGIRVAVFEGGPDVVTNLDIEAFYDTSQSDMSDHARMTHGIVKNTSPTEPNGYAPDCDLYSANSGDNDALAWSAQQGCTVISQSFHRSAEQTDADLSYDDIYKDWLALRPPYPTIVHASGNGPDDEYVNHKGFNTISVGNHDDTAAAMSGSTIFRNPDSPHGDRELPEICGNGTSVTVLGVTKSGTSFAAPAVAGTAALVQSADTVLRSWPEGTRAILLAGARRNVADGRWWADVQAGIDGSDGSGALNARESVAIARRRTSANGAGTQRGYDIGRFDSSDWGADRFLDRSYSLRAPDRPIGIFTTFRAKAVFAWNSTIDKLVIPLFNIELDIPIGSHVGVDVDLEIYDSRGSLVAGSWSFDNSYEIAEWTAVPGETYSIRPRRWSGSAWSWFGVAWTAVPVLRSIIATDVVRLQALAEALAGEG
jgi:hypothetical protein